MLEVHSEGECFVLLWFVVNIGMITAVWTWQQVTKQIHCNESVITSGPTKKKGFQITVTRTCVQQMELGQRILSNVFWELY